MASYAGLVAWSTLILSADVCNSNVRRIRWYVKWCPVSTQHNFLFIPITEACHDKYWPPLCFNLTRGNLQAKFYIPLVFNRLVFPLSVATLPLLLVNRSVNDHIFIDMCKLHKLKWFLHFPTHFSNRFWISAHCFDQHCRCGDLIGPDSSISYAGLSFEAHFSLSQEIWLWSFNASKLFDIPGVAKCYIVKDSSEKKYSLYIKNLLVPEIQTDVLFCYLGI